MLGLPGMPVLGMRPSAQRVSSQKADGAHALPAPLPQDPTCNKAVLIKTALDQLVRGSPPLLLSFPCPARLPPCPRLLLSPFRTCFPFHSVQVWGPVMGLVFFLFLAVLEGHPETFLATVRERFIPMMAANYVLW